MGGREENFLTKHSFGTKFGGDKPGGAEARGAEHGGQSQEGELGNVGQLGGGAAPGY